MIATEQTAQKKEDFPNVETIHMYRNNYERLRINYFIYQTPKRLCHF